MNQSKHTKRSAEFNNRLDGLLRELGHINEISDIRRRSLATQLVEILDRYTTDNACMVKAANDEPVFVLRGKDRLAATLVLCWAELYTTIHDEVGHQTADSFKAVLEKHSAAIDCAADMSTYHTREIPT